MSKLTTIRTRLLSGLTASAVLQILALAVAVLALFATSEAVRQVSTVKLPQASLANQLSYMSERMADTLAELIASDSDDVREASFAAFEARYADAQDIRQSLDLNAADGGHVMALEEASVALLDAAKAVNEAQATFLRYSARQDDLRGEGTVLLGDLREAIEDAIDQADAADIETLLRLGLSANVIATLYADAAASNDAEVVSGFEAGYTTYADDVRINIAILRDAATPSVRNLSDRFLTLGDGEEGLFEVRRRALAAYASAASARAAAADAATRQNEAITEVVSEISAAAADASQRTLNNVETNAFILSVIAVLSLAMAFGLGYLYVHRGILRRMDNLSGIMGRVAEGELQVEIQGLGVQDEIGTMARALEVFRQNAIKAEKLNK
ncbi:MAG: HAMP domain-containing protein, partial [Pseudomonadota bacterium]